LGLVCCFGLVGSVLGATLTGKAEVTGAHGQAGSSGVALWLIPNMGTAPYRDSGKIRMVQRHKQFLPHVLAIQTGCPPRHPLPRRPHRQRIGVSLEGLRQSVR
jgi:hypothetical protein